MNKREETQLKRSFNFRKFHMFCRPGPGFCLLRKAQENRITGGPRGKCRVIAGRRLINCILGAVFSVQWPSLRHAIAAGLLPRASCSQDLAARSRHIHAIGEHFVVGTPERRTPIHQRLFLLVKSRRSTRNWLQPRVQRLDTVSTRVQVRSGEVHVWLDEDTTFRRPIVYKPARGCNVQ